MKINFWSKYKYDIIGLFLWIMFWSILGIQYSYTLRNWQTWIIILIITIFRYMGYREGKYKMTSYLFTQAANVSFTISIDDKFNKQCTCKLRDIPSGVFFSIINDDYKNRYLKGNVVNEGSTKCWDVMNNELVIINDDTECIEYKTKMFHIPIVKVNKENKE